MKRNYGDRCEQALYSDKPSTGTHILLNADCEENSLDPFDALLGEQRMIRAKYCTAIRRDTALPPGR
ncbi:hypothetical protein [Streptomyces sp. NBC_00525]|uniref:hypothetical protein n=1 Tax=Streptomyces sp. NBC_00525 TaxID=2903660 RepID=UPI002E807A21|nr:hypothetical protein [Streptomyces sp. NBC_00525]WUC92141.1 hypothetical protein OG710_00285 [Streptomyces sp. NBC_00525]